MALKYMALNPGMIVAGEEIIRTSAEIGFDVELGPGANSKTLGQNRK